MNTYQWVVDPHFPHESRQVMYRVERVVASAKSDFQEIFIADLLDFGRALFLDGSPQSAHLDEPVYHESLVQPAMFACSSPRSVYIAGGGEGATLREVLRHPGVERVVMVDIDPVMVAMAREHLGDWHQGAFDDPRVQVLHEDARGWLADHPDRFDVILIDVADPLEGSPAALLYTQEFYALARARLNPGGMLAVQAEAADISDFEAHISVVKTVQSVFRHAASYTASVPFFGSGWGFVLASDAPLETLLSAERVARILAERVVEGLQFYDAETHRHIFALPKFLRTALGDAQVGMVIRDDRPLVVE